MGVSMTSQGVDDHGRASRGPRRGRLLSAGSARLLAFVALILAVFVVARVYGLPDVDTLRDQVDSAGSVGWLIFVGGYALIALFPAPKSALTILGGLLFGWVPGAGLSLAGALIGALMAYELGRWLGRDAVDRATGGRLARLESQLRDHGFLAVLTARLVPVLPYMLINYGSGASAVRRRDYVLGSALGMVPGSLVYSALGAWGTDLRGSVAWVAVVVLLVVAGGLWGGRRFAVSRAGQGLAAGTAGVGDPADENGR